MRNRHVGRSVAGMLLVVACADRAFANNCVVIDDFKTGASHLSVTDPGIWVVDTKPGSMLGGWRTTALALSSNRYGLPAQLKVNTAVPVLVGSFPLEANGRAEVIYGQAWPGAVLGGPVPPLAYYPKDCDRIRVHFNSAAAYNYINFNVVAWYQDDYPYYALSGVNIGPFGLPFDFCVDFPFAAFRNTGRYGPPDVALPSRGIRALDLVFQSGGAGGAEQFAVSKIETVDSASAAISPCRIVVR